MDVLDVELCPSPHESFYQSAVASPGCLVKRGLELPPKPDPSIPSFSESRSLARFDSLRRFLSLCLSLAHYLFHQCIHQTFFQPHSGMQLCKSPRV